MDFNPFVSAGYVGPAREALDVLLMLLAVGPMAGATAWAVRRLRDVVAPRAGGAFARLRCWRWRVRNRAIPALSCETALREGEVVRLRGIVESVATRPAAISGVPSVVCQHAIGERGGGTIATGFTATDFALKIADGTSVEILAATASDHGHVSIFDERPRRWTSDRVRNGWFRESRITPGDEIEVVGRLDRRVDPAAPRFGDRRPALRWMITDAGSRLSLSLRR